MNLSPIKLGLVFTGWGVLVAIFAVFGAPRLQASPGIARTMYLLGHAEQVQAAHAAAAAQPDLEEEALAVGEGSET
jgi:hypothetical protein